MARTIFDCPVFATQGGGLVKFNGDFYEFVEVSPNFPEIKNGDALPKEWSIVLATKYSSELNAHVIA